MMRAHLVLTLVFLAIVTPSFGSDSSGKFTILSMGTKSCGEVVSDFKENGRDKFNNSIWVAGYITAINEHLGSKSNIAAGTDPAAWDLWLNNYCLSNPLATLSGATEALVGQLSKRLRQ
jgi:hypothetical protein